METQIIPQYVNPPKPGKQMGSVKDQQGTYYSVAPQYLSSFQVNQPVNIGYKTSAKGYHFIEAINGAAVVTQQARPPQQPAPQQPAPQVAPQSDTAADIFVTGIVGRAMGSGQFTLNDIEPLTRTAAKAWKERHQVPATQPQSGPPDPLDDEIPW